MTNWALRKRELASTANNNTVLLISNQRSWQVLHGFSPLFRPKGDRSLLYYSQINYVQKYGFFLLKYQMIGVFFAQVNFSHFYVWIYSTKKCILWNEIPKHSQSHSHRRSRQPRCGHLVAFFREAAQTWLRGALEQHLYTWITMNYPQIDQKFNSR